jgi:adenosyl cobinamide kinase/adenosyl cobinamide phosphate guanylyltransferase
MRFSYSNISTFSQCPYRWKLHYLDKFETIPETNADNALWLGLGLHKGIETSSAELGVQEYQSHFNLITDEVINYSMQLEHQIPRVIELLPKGGEHELAIETDEFVGYIDYICGDTLYDFKFSNNIENYLTSPQLSIYKHFIELVRPDIKINHLKYIFVPKVNIRQKHKQSPPETLYEFRQRLQEQLDASEIKIIEVNYDEDSISQFLQCCQHLKTVEKFPKNQTRLCNWCPYQKYCESDGRIDYMIINDTKEETMNLPQNKKRELKKEKITTLPDMFIYGASYVGKSTFYDSLDNVLFINTDGNCDMYQNPSMYVGKTVEMNGRIKVEKSAWENFLEIIEELEKKENTFKYVALDLVEDLREHCRVYMCEKLKISHESDSNYSKAWDMVTTEFNQAIKRIKAAGYTVVYISKEVTKDVTPKGGTSYTTYNPNLPEKAANMLAGTVKLTCRAFVDEKGERWLKLKPSVHEFGGGRYNFKVDKCKLSVSELLKAINDAEIK